MLKIKLGNRNGLLYAWLCFFAHMMIEIICFTILVHTFKAGTMESALIYLTYDYLAFFPQFAVGIIHKKWRKLDIGSISCSLMLAGLLFLDFDNASIQSIISIILIALGNAFLHDLFAIRLTEVSNGKLFPAALFVGGGSFGVAIGHVLGRIPGFKSVMLFLFMTILIILVLMLNGMPEMTEQYPAFELIAPKFRKSYRLVIAAAFIVTFTRSYVGYAIPISWKKELWQTFLLFSVMGAGKALGGYLSDRFGAWKTGVFSTLVCIPFLLIGDDMMMVSLIGIFMFSLTMSITFGMILSVMRNNPGIAFGITTIALLIGILPTFFFPTPKGIAGYIIVTALSLGCSSILAQTLKKA